MDILIIKQTDKGIVGSIHKMTHFGIITISEKRLTGKQRHIQRRSAVDAETALFQPYHLGMIIGKFLL